LAALFKIYKSTGGHNHLQKKVLSLLIFLTVVLAVSFQAFAQAENWVFDGVNWIYQLDNGDIARNGWYTINGKSYCFDSDGVLYTNEITPDNYYVNADGEYVDDSEIDPNEMSIKSKDCRYIVFDKSSHHLELWQFGEKTHTFIASSGYGVGDKEREGDMKTPEGVFYICKKVPNSSYYLGLAINYPTIEDAERGITTELISERQYNQVVNANLSGSYYWESPLGGVIEFHGNRQSTDVTSGCIGMRDEDIEILYGMVEVGDKVLIQP